MKVVKYGSVHQYIQKRKAILTILLLITAVSVAFAIFFCKRVGNDFAGNANIETIKQYTYSQYFSYLIYEYAKYLLFFLILSTTFFGFLGVSAGYFAFSYFSFVSFIKLVFSGVSPLKYAIILLPRLLVAIPVMLLLCTELMHGNQMLVCRIFNDERRHAKLSFGRFLPLILFAGLAGIAFVAASAISALAIFIL